MSDTPDTDERPQPEITIRTRQVMAKTTRKAQQQQPPKMQQQIAELRQRKAKVKKRIAVDHTIRPERERAQCAVDVDLVDRLRGMDSDKVH